VFAMGQKWTAGVWRFTCADPWIVYERTVGHLDTLLWHWFLRVRFLVHHLRLDPQDSLTRSARVIVP